MCNGVVRRQLNRSLKIRDSFLVLADSFQRLTQVVNCVLIFWLDRNRLTKLLSSRLISLLAEKSLSSFVQFDCFGMRRRASRLRLRALREAAREKNKYQTKAQPAHPLSVSSWSCCRLARGHFVTGHPFSAVTAGAGYYRQTFTKALHNSSNA